MVDKLKRFCGECGSKLPTVIDPEAPTECQNAYCESTSREVYAFCIDDLYVATTCLEAVYLRRYFIVAVRRMVEIRFIYVVIAHEACTTIRFSDATKLGS